MTEQETTQFLDYSRTEWNLRKLSTQYNRNAALSTPESPMRYYWREMADIALDTARYYASLAQYPGVYESIPQAYYADWRSIYSIERHNEVLGLKLNSWRLARVLGGYDSYGWNIRI